MSTTKNQPFRQQLMLLLLDKFLIGIFLLFLGYVINSALAKQDQRATEAARDRNATLAVSMVLTEHVADQREVLLANVAELMAVLNQYESQGIVPSSERKRTREAVEAIENAIYLLGIVNSDVVSKGQPFVALAKRIRSDLVNKLRSRDEFRSDANNLATDYATLTNELRSISATALHIDRNTVDQILKSQNSQ